MKKKLLILVTGSVGASNLDAYLYYLKEFYDLTVILSENSKQFINKNLVSYFCDKVYDQLFIEGVVPHVILPNEADLVLVLPATANVLGKIANGIADDLVTSSVLNFSKSIIFCPNMNSTMWNNPIVQKNVSILEELGHFFLLESKRSYEVGLRKATDSMCSMLQPQALVREVLSIEKIVLGEGH
ncbi:flavoprotein [Streptococcus thermophilus]|uniref:flavoprotein n=1 Tax=Streptococcus thermophilus TaxID=1308 RepID=UPI0002177273|nr:phosphopantothenate--cysteine ligase family flavoprotein [Streptococcus thermophilus]MCE2061487.1 flavoprotein [Streptococcus thermophilus]MCE2066679.1 flavoprotein [Streptococcus thermophilus]MCE2069938.1 flavoprotein [Streptococcus thermophilus]MCE2086513.1 flavoprotein [Streptococcus thermophilus]MCE2091759.1 flavoprotein [Streptococcus thermophilus]